MSVTTAESEGFPALSGSPGDPTIGCVAVTAPAVALPIDARSDRASVLWSLGAAPVGRVGTGLSAVLATAVAAGLVAPMLDEEPVFAWVTTATTATLVTLGAHLVLRQRERFTGWCFGLAGISWMVTLIDVWFPHGGPLLQWLLSGSTYVLLGWGILRYRRPRLSGPLERRFVGLSAALTIGVAVLTAPLIPAATLGYKADAAWPSLLGPPGATTAALATNGAGYAVLGVVFCVLMVRIRRTAPVLSAAFLQPMILFGVLLAVGAPVIQVMALAAPDVLGQHTAAAAIGALILALSGGLTLTMVLQRASGSRFVALLPRVRTPESVASYVRAVVDDPTAELWYRSADGATLLDGHGRSRGDEPPDGTGYSAWITDSEGEPVALLVGAASLGDDLDALETFLRVLAILAENARLSVLLRMRLAELEAARIAERIAYDNAREQFHRNLHDGIQQTIAAARMDLDGLHDVVSDEEGHAVVGDLERKLSFALDQVHSLKRGADPPELRFGLKPAIERSIAELRMDARCHVDHVDLGVLTLPVYYLVRESLTNVHKHAEAGRIEVDVCTDRRSIRVQVRDDGVGGASESGRGGIAGMRRRAEELGGRLDVLSERGAGTSVCATLPFLAS